MEETSQPGMWWCTDCIPQRQTQNIHWWENMHMIRNAVWTTTMCLLSSWFCASGQIDRFWACMWTRRTNADGGTARQVDSPNEHLYGVHNRSFWSGLCDGCHLRHFCQINGVKRVTCGRWECSHGRWVKHNNTIQPRPKGTHRRWQRTWTEDDVLFVL